MSQISLQAAIQAAIDDSIGFIESETVDQRKTALQYYLRQPLGNEVEGKSQVVTGEVAEAIDGALPALLRIFTGSDQIVVANPSGPGDEASADQATDYLNYIFLRDNPGVSIMRDWFFDALLQKNGIVKAYWEDKKDVSKEEYEGLTDDELAMMMQDDEIEVVSQNVRQIPAVDPVMAEVIMAAGGEVPTYNLNDVKIKKTKNLGRVVIENVPPEEFLISKKGVAIRGSRASPFVAHRRQITRSDLIAMGFDKKQMEAAGYTLPALRSFSYPQWVNYQMSMNNPNYKGAIEIAIQDVQAHEQLTGGLTDAQRKRYVETRAKEVIRFGGENELTGEKILGLRLSEKEFEDAEIIARSQIFTHNRGGIHSKWSGALARMTSNKKAGFLLVPLIPFTTIIGNLSDTMADFNPVTGIARANGISMSELIAEFQRSNGMEGSKKNEKPVLSAKMGDQFPRAKSFGDFVDMRVKRAFETKDSKYYEQMARAWTGIQALTALALTVSSNPYQGFGLTGSQDQKNPYMIMIDGEPLFSYKDIPFLGPAAAIVAKWHEYARENPDKKDAEFYEDAGARLWYAMGAAETLPGKVSIAEGSIRAMDIFSDCLEIVMGKQGKGEDTPDWKSMALDLVDKISRPYINFLTKAMPQRASALEQFEQLFDPTVYSKSDILDATVYAFTGVLYKLPWIEKTEMVDIFGDPVEKLPGEDRMGFLQSFRDDVSQRPWVKFLNERSIVFPSLQNTEVAWEDKDAIFGVKYENYDTKQFAYYAKKSGENFKKRLNGYTDEDGEKIEGIMDVDSATQQMRDETIVEYNHKPVTLTEKLVREAMSAARSEARKQVKKEFTTSTEGPMTDGIGEDF